MATLSEVLELAVGDTASSITLSAQSIAVIEYALSFLESLVNWDAENEEFTPAEIDDIEAAVSLAQRELNGF